jgi:hypothetical protein
MLGSLAARERDRLRERQCQVGAGLSRHRGQALWGPRGGLPGATGRPRPGRGLSSFPAGAHPWTRFSRDYRGTDAETVSATLPRPRLGSAVPPWAMWPTTQEAKMHPSPFVAATGLLRRYRDLCILALEARASPGPPHFVQPRLLLSAGFAFFTRNGSLDRARPRLHGEPSLLPLDLMSNVVRWAVTTRIGFGESR